jgi:ABC-2 type transport system ATP-binding protein
VTAASPDAAQSTGTGESVVEIVGLSKRFSSAVLAVDNLSFTVERGQVCGLLGPNGAGKTTCLRVLLGLIRPSAGETRLFGEQVRPGSGQLRRVGALIESSAFVPHLSGMRNLRMWWEEGGARWRDANLDEALAIADLDTAIDRKVKTYSQGMRQRLGLARVLLGKPEILVLDEPTNGLDPQEMREVRQLVHRVADAGATVLFSSHVLAEVEQTCTHAVVMDRGKFVAGGSVAALIGTSGSVYLEVSNVARAQAVLADLPFVVAVTPEPPGLSVELQDHSSRAAMVKALVDAEIGVDTVMLRRRLEDAFLGLVDAERA